MPSSASEASDVQTLATLLQEEGYRAKIEGDVVRSMTSGFRVSLYPYGESIQLRLGIKRQGTYLELRHVNDFNARYRFAKVYLDRDGDIILESDFPFDFAEGKEEAAAKLGEIMAIFDGSISSLKDKIDEAEAETKTGSADSEEASSQAAPKAAETSSAERAGIERSEK
jgi:Putative bacterial sensory transduction regulator